MSANLRHLCPAEKDAEAREIPEHYEPSTNIVAARYHIRRPLHQTVVFRVIDGAHSVELGCCA